MTEDEARTKWCPFSRVVFGYKDGTTQTFNRFVAPIGDEETDKIVEAIRQSPGARCIGSECMAWRTLSDGSGGWCGLVN